ncbi:MAG: signal peptidase II [Clostridiaceae bacterium]|nr:signal peptidase II [Clostridiaceae bacterium]
MKYYLTLVVLLMDQLTKLWASTYLQLQGSIPILENIFHLTYVENRGAAFGVLHGQRWFFILITIAIVGFILIYFSLNKNYPKPMMIGLSLIVAGALGNLIDRVVYGYVVDFFDFRVWPVFNIADMAIVVGQILVAYVILKYDNLNQKEM